MLRLVEFNFKSKIGSNLKAVTVKTTEANFQIVGIVLQFLKAETGISLPSKNSALHLHL